MAHSHSLQLLPAAFLVCLAAQADPAALLGLEVQGGSGDDAAYARVAAALPEGAPVDQAGLQAALAAIRLTDRFRRVDGELLDEQGGMRARVRLDPWPTLRRLVWRGDARRAEIWKNVRGLRAGMRPGELRLAAWTRDLQEHLREQGLPQAQVTWAREDNDSTLIITVQAGAEARVRRLELVGNPLPFSEEQILHWTKLVPGQTLWDQAVQMAAVRNLRRRFQRAQHYEAQTDITWDGQGTVRVKVVPGPRVLLEKEGDGLGLSTSLKDLVPLVRAERYSPDLLDEGDRRILRYLRSRGYLDAQVSHRREMTRPGPPGFEEVTITYRIARGERSRLAHLRFEGNTAFSEAELRRAADLPGRYPVLGGAPSATPDLLDALENRVKNLYLGRGYTETSLRRQLERKDGQTDLVVRIHEGPQRLLRWMRLELPPGGFGASWQLGECLPLIFSDQALHRSQDPEHTYVSDRRTMAGIQGTLAQSGPAGAADPVVLTFTLSQPIPLFKGDLARVFTALKQQRLPALGVMRPLVRLNLEADGSGVRIEVPDQPMEKIRRLVVVGSDKTRARAVLRETRLSPGSPLDTDQLSRAQARLSYLGAFQRADLKSLATAPTTPTAPDDPVEGPPAASAPAGPPAPWKEGDLQLSLEERPPYVVSTSFGYDRSQGYHVGFGVQQLNVGGMGRTVDYSLRAGDGTIKNRKLARMFPTGKYNRSVDSFTVGYNDPWFAPNVLADRTAFRSEAAYIQENQALYELHRRRLTQSLQWSLTPQVSFSLGYRWERVDVGSNDASILPHDLSVIAHYPAQTTVSAPFAQLARDTRDNGFDPTRGMYSVARVEFANQLFLTSKNSSFVKVDLRNQWTWPVGYKARAGVVALGLRVGLAKPTAASAEDLPLSERFFAGGPFSFRGVEPDALGVQAQVPAYDSAGNAIMNGTTHVTYSTPVGGQGLALINLEYRFPILSSVWGEVFADSGQVYQSLSRMSYEKRRAQVQSDDQVTAAYPPFRTALGLGLIFKVGVPIKIEYAADLNRILGRPRSQNDRDTQLKSLLISAGFQF